MFALKDILTVKNDRRVFNYYAAARLDGLEKREELEVGRGGVGAWECGGGRDDGLVWVDRWSCRSVETTATIQPKEQERWEGLLPSFRSSMPNAHPGGGTRGCQTSRCNPTLPPLMW